MIVYGFKNMDEVKDFLRYSERQGYKRRNGFLPTQASSLRLLFMEKTLEDWWELYLRLKKATKTVAWIRDVVGFKSEKIQHFREFCNHYEEPTIPDLLFWDN